MLLDCCSKCYWGCSPDSSCPLGCMETTPTRRTQRHGALGRRTAPRRVPRVGRSRKGESKTTSQIRSTTAVNWERKVSKIQYHFQVTNGLKFFLFPIAYSYKCINIYEQSFLFAQLNSSSNLKVVVIEEEYMS